MRAVDTSDTAVLGGISAEASTLNQARMHYASQAAPPS